jgi:hypothetical protein
VFCVHGGIPSPANLKGGIENINSIPVPLRNPESESSLAWDIMWSDPLRFVLIFFICMIGPSVIYFTVFVLFVFVCLGMQIHKLYPTAIYSDQNEQQRRFDMIGPKARGSSNQLLNVSKKIM